MNVAEYVVEFLRDAGVRTAYTVSGTGSIHLDDALDRHPDVACVCARHEAAAALMATGDAKLTGSPALAVVTSGPGAVNAVPGVTDAWADSVPVLVVSGQVETRHIDRGTRSFGVQGLDVVECVRSLTKYAAVVEDPYRIRIELETALHEATTGRRGPVWLDIPVDVQSATVDPDTLPGRAPSRPEPTVPAGTAAGRILDALRSARRPLLVVGQGVRLAGAVERFRDLVEPLGVPVVASRLGHDILGYDCPVYFGQAGIRGRPHTALITREADVVVSLGSGLSVGLVGEDHDAFAGDALVVGVDVDPAQLTKKGRRVDVPLCADVGPVIDGLLEAVRDGRAAGVAGEDGWRARCAALKRDHPVAAAPSTPDGLDAYWLVRSLDERLGAAATFVVDTGSAYYISGQVMEFRSGARELTSSTLVNMGASLPLAVGAACAAPGTDVFVLVGDGAIELNLQELATLRQYDLDVKVFVLNNGGYASIRESGDALCDGRRLAEPTLLDLRKVADTFGLPYWRGDTAGSLDEVLTAVTAVRGPVLCEMVCDPEQRVLGPLLPEDAARVPSHDGVRRPSPALAAGSEVRR